MKISEKIFYKILDRFGIKKLPRFIHKAGYESGILMFAGYVIGTYRELYSQKHRGLIKIRIKDDFKELREKIRDFVLKET